MIESWHKAIGAEKEKPYFKTVMSKVAQARQAHRIYPPAQDVFAAFKVTPFDQIKVVILGQDPYHGVGQAQGLAFSVHLGVPIPPSLKNIYKELQSDIVGFVPPAHGNLLPWAQQGVFLLNTVLTVQEGQAHSHASWGWETFTDAVIQAINTGREHVVFMLWGSHAQKKGAFIDRKKHCVLMAAHPSPLSAHRGFFGCHHFSQCNQYLVEQGITPINWQN